MSLVVELALDPLASEVDQAVPESVEAELPQVVFP